MSSAAVEELRAISAPRESGTVEFRNSTARLPRVRETLCGTLDWFEPTFPPATPPEMLSQPHTLIAQTSLRTGAVNTCGQGTDRVIDVCQEFGVEPPIFDQDSQPVVVTLPTMIAPAPQATPPVLVWLLPAADPESRWVLQQSIGSADPEHFRPAYLEPSMAVGWLEMTIPDKPRSSKQRDHRTEAGQRIREAAPLGISVCRRSGRSVRGIPHRWANLVTDQPACWSMNLVTDQPARWSMNLVTDQPVCWSKNFVTDHVRRRIAPPPQMRLITT